MLALPILLSMTVVTAAHAPASKRLHLSSFAYTKPEGGGAIMWTVDDWITTSDSAEAPNTSLPWQSLILQTGDDIVFANLSAAVLAKTSVNLPVLWYWGGWLEYGGNATAVVDSFRRFQARQKQLQELYPHLPSSPFGVYMGDEPDLARQPERQKYLSAGLALVKAAYPSAITYLNMLFASIGCPAPSPGAYSGLCRTWPANANHTELAMNLGKMPLDWISTDEYYDVSIEQYRQTYNERLYPHLRPEQRVILLPFAAYCEIGCTPNATIDLQAADAHTLAKATNHYAWARADNRVVGLFLYRLKNLWQGATMAGLDACNNPWGTGLGLVDRCGIEINDNNTAQHNASRLGHYATPKTLAFYQQQGVATHLMDQGAGCDDVFVDSVDGSDDADGCTARTSVATLARAQQLTWTRKHPGGEHEGSEQDVTEVTVWMSGEFYLREGLKFTAADKHTRWTSLPASPTPATIYGGIALPDIAKWKPVTDPDTLARVKDPKARKLLRELSLASSPFNLSTTDIGRPTRRGFVVGGQAPPLELFFNGSRLKRSRWPKSGAPPSSISRIDNPNKTSPVFSVNSTIPLHWNASMAPEGGGVWLDGLLGQNWVWTYNRVKVLANGSLTLAYPEVSDLQLFSPTYCCHNRFFFDNVFEEISQPGEYYVNITEKKVYLVPPTEAETETENATAHVPMFMASTLTEPLFSFDVTASDMSFTNITVTVSRGTAFSAMRSSRIVIENVEVSNMGLDAVVLGSESAVLSSHLHHLGGTGVQVTGGSTAKLIPGNSSVRNCEIHHFAEVNQVYTPAVSVYGVGNSVEHCDIHDGPHCGMLLYGNDHLVSNNIFSYIALQYVDMGAIYVNLGLSPFERGSKIINNFFHHLGVRHGKNLVVGVYPDSSTMGLTVFGNVFYKAGTEASAAVMGNGFSYINTSNNIYVDCARPFFYNDWLKMSWGASEAAKYVEAWRQAFNSTTAAGMLDTFYERYPELRRFWVEDRFAPKSNSFTNSIVYNPTIPRAKGNETSHGYDCRACDGLSDVKGTDTVWITDSDPGFESVDSMDFTLPRDKVVERIPGWVTIDFKAIGLLDDGEGIGPR